MPSRRAFLAAPVGAALFGGLDASGPGWRFGFTPGRTLRSGDASAAGLRPEPLARLRPDAARYLVPTADHPGHPAYAGAVVLAARGGVVAAQEAVGWGSATPRRRPARSWICRCRNGSR